MDKTPYHSKKIDKVPTTATKKAEIQQWMRDKNIVYEDDLLKAELLQIVRTHKHLYGDYVVDQMARQAGHTVLRLPPYHCELNAIELVWAQVKQ
jgi:transposase